MNGGDGSDINSNIIIHKMCLWIDIILNIGRKND